MEGVLNKVAKNLLQELDTFENQINNNEDLKIEVQQFHQYSLLQIYTRVDTITGMQMYPLLAS